MKCREYYTSWSRDKPYECSIEEYDQPFWPWLRSRLFHYLLWKTETPWTQWFWHLPWYRTVWKNPTTEESSVEWSPLCLWLDCKDYELRNAKKHNVTRRQVSQEEYDAATD